MQKQIRKGRRNGNKSLKEARFFTLDCTKNRIETLENYPKESKFDITSCQFSIHYGFESEEQAKILLSNACENVKVGGYFLGTTLNSNELIRRLRKSQQEKNDKSLKLFGSDVYKIDFEKADSFSEFGCKYHFKLDGVVNCPEFLCDLNVLQKLAAAHGFVLEDTFTFREAFDRFKDLPKCKTLLSVINALEPYQPRSSNLTSKVPGDYKHAEGYFNECLRQKKENRSQERFSIGSISQSEWEAISVYQCFIFKRVSEEKVGFEFNFDETELLKMIDETLDNDQEMEPPLVKDYFPRRLNYAYRK